MSENVLHTFPQLETEGLKLIRISNEHQEDLFKIFGDKQVTKYYNLKPLKEAGESRKLIQHFESRFQDKKGIRWGISLKKQNEIIGTIGFNNFSKSHRATIGYDLQPAFWGKGIMKEVLTKVLDFGFHELEVNRIEAEVMKGNKQSVKLLEKMGFINEGLLRDWMFWEGKHYDMHMFALLKREQ